MSFWSDNTPSLIALCGIPLGVLANAAVTHVRDRQQRNEQTKREDDLRERQQQREDAIRHAQQQREVILAEKSQHAWITQRWWERKAETYTRIMEALWHLLEVSREEEREVEAVLEDLPKPPSDPKHDFAAHREELRKIIDIGTFIISPDVAAALTAFFDATDSIPDWLHYEEVVDIRMNATQTCLDAVRAYALKDLRLIGPE